MSVLYKQVCDQILDQIASGERCVGDRLPPESDFAAELGISRSTLRLAFAELEQGGVLHRQKRSGTKIIAAEPQRKFSMPTTGVQELLSLGRDTALLVTDTSTIRTEDVDALDGHSSETGYWLKISGVRSLNSETNPFSVNQIYVPARFSGVEPLLKKHETSVFQVIEKYFDVTVASVKQTTKAIACPPREAKLMGLSAGTPVLQIGAALYTRQGELMEISVATFDPERFQLQTEVEID